MFHRSTSTTLFVSTFLALGALAVACGGDSDGSDGTGNAAGSGTAGSGTAGCGTAGSGTVTKECTDYATCAETKCDAEYKQCLGANYKSGDFTGGTCATYQSCIKGCNACDTACTQACKPDAACTSCLSMTVGACVTGKCMTELTACSKSQMGAAGSGSGGSGSGAASCMTLQACCDKIMDASIKMGCTTSASSGSDTACMSALSGYMMFCK